MSRGYINYWHIQFKTLNNCIFSVEWLLVRWFIRNNVLILFLLKVSQKKLSSSQREKIKNKKIQRFDSWVAITNSFHIPTLKKPLKKIKKSNTLHCLSPFAPLSLSSEMYFLCTILKQFLSIWLKNLEKWLRCKWLQISRFNFSKWLHRLWIFLLKIPQMHQIRCPW